MMRESMMNTGNMMMGWGGMVLGPLMMIGILALVILGIVMLVKCMINSSSNSSFSNQALNILQERFASGDIDEAEYQDRKRKITA